MNNRSLANLKRGTLIALLVVMCAGGVRSCNNRRQKQKQIQIENIENELKNTLSQLAKAQGNYDKYVNHVRDSLWTEEVQLMYKKWDSLSLEKQKALMNAIVAYEKRVMPKGKMKDYFSSDEINCINDDLMREGISKRVSANTSFATFWNAYKSIYLCHTMDIWALGEYGASVPEDNAGITCVTGWGYVPHSVDSDTCRKDLDLPYLVNFNVPEMKRIESKLETLHYSANLYGAHVEKAFSAMDSAELKYANKIKNLKTRAKSLAMELHEKKR